jgi:hypothetical protein
MAWQTPKTNWAGPDGVRNTDFNRIEGNAQHLYDNMAALRKHVDDTLYAISQRTAIGNLPVGAELALYENGVLVPYIKIHEDYHGSGRNLVVRKSSYMNATLQNDAEGYYADCKTDVFLNYDFINVLDAAVQASIAAVGVPVRTASGVATIQRKVFLLSRTEYNFSGGIVEGSINYYFTNPDRRVAAFDGMAFEHWTRSIVDIQYEANFVTNTGALGTGHPSVFRAGIRPAFTLPVNFEVVAVAPNTANTLAVAELVEEA